jgi:putative transposase
MPKNAHLARLDRIYTDRPIFFITACITARRHVLNNASLHEICREVWRNAEQHYNWLVGRYVLMPDHAHFFCAPRGDTHPLSTFVGKWKEWTAKYASRRCSIATPLWQPEFFDHVLRTHESYEQKWNYVGDNPIRAGLTTSPDDWPYQGTLNDLRYD